MSEHLQVPEAIRKLIGTVSEPAVFEIEKGAIRKFAEAIGDDNPKWTTQAPPTFLCSLSPGGLPALSDVVFTRALDGGNEWEYFQPVKAGDVITAQSKIVDASMRSGRLGPMLFIVSEVAYTNQKGQLIAKARNTAIRY